MIHILGSALALPPALSGINKNAGPRAYEVWNCAKFLASPRSDASR